MTRNMIDRQYSDGDPDVTDAGTTVPVAGDVGMGTGSGVISETHGETNAGSSASAVSPGSFATAVSTGSEAVAMRGDDPVGTQYSPSDTDSHVAPDGKDGRDDGGLTDGKDGGLTDGKDVAGLDRQIRYYRNWLDENSRESKDDRKKRERRERSKKIVAAIGDGLSALGNLYYTTRYAPSAKLESLSKSVGNSIDKIREARKKKDDEYTEYSLRLGELEDKRAKTLRDLAEQKEKLRAAREAAELKKRLGELDAAIKGKEVEKRGHEADKAKSEAEEAGVKAGYAEPYYKARNENEAKKGAVLDSQTKKNLAQGNAAGAQAAYYRSKSGGYSVITSADGVETRVYDKDIDNYFSALPQEKRTEAGNPQSGSNKHLKPTKDQKMQAIAEHERTVNRKKKATKGKGYP